MDKLNDFTFYALQQCLFSPENKEKILKKINAKLSIQNSIQSAEVNALVNKINGLENAQNNLIAYLEAGRATQTIMDKIEKNEAELAILKTQLNAKNKEVYTVSDDVYDDLVEKFLNYMGTEKSSEAYALRDAAISSIDIGDDSVTIKFHSGVKADDDTINYFNDNMEVSA